MRKPKRGAEMQGASRCRGVFLKGPSVWLFGAPVALLPTEVTLIVSHVIIKSRLVHNVYAILQNLVIACDKRDPKAKSPALRLG